MGSEGSVAPVTHAVMPLTCTRSPRCNFAKVTVNGKYLGIYSNVESVKSPFLERAFGDSSGGLFEGTVVDWSDGGKRAF